MHFSKGIQFLLDSNCLFFARQFGFFLEEVVISREKTFVH